MTRTSSLRRSPRRGSVSTSTYSDPQIDFLEYGRSDLLSFEACVHTVNPVNGAVGLLSSGNWQVYQSAVETVLSGGVRPLPAFTGPSLDESSASFSRGTCTPQNRSYQFVPSASAYCGVERIQQRQPAGLSQKTIYEGLEVETPSRKTSRSGAAAESLAVVLRFTIPGRSESFSPACLLPSVSGVFVAVGKYLL